MATMDPEVKNSISHRAIAAQSFLDELKKINIEQDYYLFVYPPAMVRKEMPLL